MEFEFEFTKMEAEEGMKKSISHYRNELTKISAGSANPMMLEGIEAEYFGSMTPISQIAAISVPEPRQLLIKPYDISTTKVIVAAINAAHLGVQAVDEGDKARMTIPELTTERRKELTKSFSQQTEHAKVVIRAARQDANKKIKAAELSEDDEKNFLDSIQKLTDKYTAQIQDLADAKQKELMTI